MLPGGGIGPELMAHVREVFNAIGAPVDFEIIDIHPHSEGNDDLEYAITSIKRNGVAIKGNIETKSEETEIVSRNVALRNELDLFVNVVECKSYDQVPARQKDINIAIVRQNTEGEYAMLEHEVRCIHNIQKRKCCVKFSIDNWIRFDLNLLQSVPGVVESMKVVTIENSERVARYAFEYGIVQYYKTMLKIVHL